LVTYAWPVDIDHLVSIDEGVVSLILDVTDDDSVFAAAQSTPRCPFWSTTPAFQCGPPSWKGPSTTSAGLDINLFGIMRDARAIASVLGRHAPGAMVNVLSALSWLSFGRGYEISKSAARPPGGA
jgi:hypothetical protein